MNRRCVLALVGASASVPGVYVAWNWYQAPSLPDGMDVETLYVSGDVFGEPVPPDRDLDWREERYRIIRDGETGADKITFDDSAITFVEETDFDASSLVLVQTGMQTEPKLALEEISRTGDGIHLDVTVEHPWWRGVNDDLGIHSLLVRVTDERDDALESVSVAIEGYL
ncbi:hypothetical protein [Natronosalvus rutilus]|uniref:Uncharacterized protein n=1 Tax=Natronosalvus rutilus TaxID=2953753 RepID=A0A9E7NAG8_9EURY|nr:hypothetical protein [Natronosalvus rutilus]UTF54435.1 hypothetical protein NGM29_03915 [Natronosalvus rutilus]